MEATRAPTQDSTEPSTTGPKSWRSNSGNAGGPLGYPALYGLAVVGIAGAAGLLAARGFGGTGTWHH